MSRMMVWHAYYPRKNCGQRTRLIYLYPLPIAFSLWIVDLASQYTLPPHAIETTEFFSRSFHKSIFIEHLKWAFDTAFVRSTLSNFYHSTNQMHTISFAIQLWQLDRAKKSIHLNHERAAKEISPTNDLFMQLCKSGSFTIRVACS